MVLVIVVYRPLSAIPVVDLDARKNAVARPRSTTIAPSEMPRIMTLKGKKKDGHRDPCHMGACADTMATADECTNLQGGLVLFFSFFSFFFLKKKRENCLAIYMLDSAESGWATDQRVSSVGRLQTGERGNKKRMSAAQTVSVDCKSVKRL